MKTLFRSLGFSNLPTAEEQLEMLTKEIKQERHRDAVLAIRRDGYIPDYNKPKLHTDYKLTIIENDVEKEVSSTVTTTCKRPQEFSGLEEWYNTMRQDHLKEIEEKKKKELREQLWQLTIDVHFTPAVMREMMKVE